MTFDTFDTYNTDEAYNDKGTTAKGLVAAYKKDNPEGTKDDFYSKLNKTWAQDKDGHVKNAVDEAFKVETPATETKPTEEKTVEEVVAEEPEAKTQINVNPGDKEFQDQQTSISDYAKNEEMEKQRQDELQAWKDIGTTIENSRNAFKNIDDHMVGQLPTFMTKRYLDGEFGDPKSSDAKLRLAHFMINGVQSKLKNASNAAMIAAGKSPMFADTTSDYDKYQQTNLAKGMENRWRKYEADTQSAIDLAKKQGMEEQDIKNSLRKISTNANMQSAFNMMNEKQKLYAIQVISEIGDKIKGFDRNDVSNFLIGALVSDKNFNSQDLLAAMGIKFGTDVLDSDAAKDVIEKIKDHIGGNETKDSKDVTAGVSGSGKINDNLKNYKTIDGETISFNMVESKEGKEKLRSLMDDLSNKYARGEIDEATFREYYTPLYNESKSHMGTKSKSPDELLKENNKLIKEAVTNKAKELFGKNYKEGSKALDYFKSSPALFDYFNDNKEPNYLDAKKLGIKDMKDYNKAESYYKKIKDANALDLVKKW